MLRLELADKFWEIETTARTLTTRSGRLGTAGTTKKQSFKGESLRREAVRKLTDAKFKAGWRDPDKVLKCPDVERDASHEAALRADRDDAASYDVYADWLQAHGNALGELIALQRALAKKKDSAKTKREKQLIKDYKLPIPTLMSVEWKWGLWDSLRLENNVDWLDSYFEPLNLASFAFGHTACAALRHLKLGVMRWEHNHQDVPAILAEAARHAWAKDLVALDLGDVSGNVDMAHHVVGKVGAPVSNVFPALRSLRIHSGEQSWHKDSFSIAGLDLPALETLKIESCAFSKARVKELLAAKLPSLTSLTVWFGDENADCNTKLADIGPILSGKAFPNLTTLGLCNASFEKELARDLPSSPLASKLVELDLSRGVLDDNAARALANHVPSFPKLKVLDVSRNYLTKVGIRDLARAFKKVEVRSDRQQEIWDDEEPGDHRYVDVYE